MLLSQPQKLSQEGDLGLWESGKSGRFVSCFFAGLQQVTELHFLICRTGMTQPLHRVTRSQERQNMGQVYVRYLTFLESLGNPYLWYTSGVFVSLFLAQYFLLILFVLTIKHSPIEIELPSSSGIEIIALQSCSYFPNHLPCKRNACLWLIL